MYHGSFCIDSYVQKVVWSKYIFGLSDVVYNVKSTGEESAACNISQVLLIVLLLRCFVKASHSSFEERICGMSVLTDR